MSITSEGITFAANPSVIIMATAGWDLENWITETLEKFIVWWGTLDIVQENWVWSLSEVCIIVRLSNWNTMHSSKLMFIL